jgi:hypothetical protein
MSSADLRVSDADRDRAAELLRAHAGEGRLTVEELDEWTARALSAVTRGQLDALFADLPPLHPPAAREPAPAQPARRGPWVPGTYAFAESWRAPADRATAMRELLEHVAPPLHRHGYELSERTPDRLVFTFSHRPLWTILLAIFLFPIGLLALLYKEHERLTIDLIEDERGTLVSARGVASLPVRRAFATLEP